MSFSLAKEKPEICSAFSMRATVNDSRASQVAANVFKSMSIGTGSARRDARSTLNVQSSDGDTDSQDFWISGQSRIVHAGKDR